MLWVLFPPALHASEAVSLSFLRGKTVAVAVFPQNRDAENVARIAQSRIEQILADNEIAVLDEEKTRELKNVFNTLEDPAAFVTAETFIENSSKFNIDGLLGIYLSAEAVPGLADYYSATAHADIRFIDKNSARVKALSTPAMGTRGIPPSDGLTRSSAAINAAQRAVDAACQSMGFEMLDITRPRSVSLDLVGPEPFHGAGGYVAAQENDARLARLAPFHDETWRVEEATCTVRAPAGDIGAVAGYIRDTDFRRRPQRLYGSRIHVVDTAAAQSILTFDCSPVEMKSREEPNTKKILGCAFLGSWRYLTAITGNHIFLWDVETGREIAKLPLPAEMDTMQVQTKNNTSRIVVQTSRNAWEYRIVRANR